jgi:hypothetical protein
MPVSLPQRTVLARGTPLPGAVVVQYVRFQDVPGRREFVLLVQAGDNVREYTVSIPLASFTKRRALLQDGPDICYQKLVRELTGTDLVGTARLTVTDDDLERYRDSHLPPARRPHPRRVV